jgi:hypothetical protein
MSLDTSLTESVNGQRDLRDSYFVSNFWIRKVFTVSLQAAINGVSDRVWRLRFCNKLTYSTFSFWTFSEVRTDEVINFSLSVCFVAKNNENTLQP